MNYKIIFSSISVQIGPGPGAAGDLAQISCTGFCRAFNMHPLSPNDDSTPGGRIRRRHREEGVAKQEQQIETTTKTVQLFESVSFE